MFIDYTEDLISRKVVVLHRIIFQKATIWFFEVAYEIWFIKVLVISMINFFTSWRLFVCTRISMAGMSKKDRSRIRITDWCRYVINAMSYIDMQELTTITWKIMIQAKNFDISCTGISITCMDGWCHRNCPWIVSNGEKTCLCLVKNK